MEHRDVEVHIKGWDGDCQVPLDKAAVLLGSNLIVDGQEINPPNWELNLGGFVALTVHFQYENPVLEGDVPEDVQRKWARDCEQQTQELREWASQFTPDQWLLGSDDTKIILPVSRLTVVQDDSRYDWSKAAA